MQPTIYWLVPQNTLEQNVSEQEQQQEHTSQQGENVQANLPQEEGCQEHTFQQREDTLADFPKEERREEHTFHQDAQVNFPQEERRQDHTFQQDVKINFPDQTTSIHPSYPPTPETRIPEKEIIFQQRQVKKNPLKRTAESDIFETPHRKKLKTCLCGKKVIHLKQHIKNKHSKLF